VLYWQFAKEFRFTPEQVDQMTTRQIQAFQILNQNYNKKEEMNMRSQEHHQRARNRMHNMHQSIVKKLNNG